MDEKEELLKDYKDCQKYIDKFHENNLAEMMTWTIFKYNKWASKGNEYAICIQKGVLRPNDEKQAVYNSLVNLKGTLKNIAIIKSIPLDEN